MYLLVGILAAVENVFPPVPADTAVAIGAFLSQGGSVSAGMIFGVTLTANLVSAAAVYVAARTFGRRFFEGAIGRRLLNPAALLRLEDLYRRYGTWGIFLSRFVPGVRAVVPPFAGIAKLGAARALIPAGIASAIWYGTLTLVVVLVAKRVSDVVRLVSGANRVALIAAGAVALVGLIWWIGRRRRRRPPGEPGGRPAR